MTTMPPTTARRIVFAQSNARLFTPDGFSYAVTQDEPWDALDPLVTDPRNSWNFGPEPVRVCRTVPAG
jgi:hypothetical protein